MNSFFDWMTNYAYYCMIMAVGVGIVGVIGILLHEWDTRKTEDAGPIKTTTLGLK